MNIKELNEELLKLLEMANSEECGIEVTKEMMDDVNEKEGTNFDFNNLQDKVNFLIHKIETTQDRTNIYGLKVNDVAIKTWTHPTTGETKTYHISLCLGRTNKHNIVRTDSGYGLYHMKYGESNHWGSSKQCLKNITWLQRGTISPIKTGLYTYDLTKFAIKFKDRTYGIALDYDTWNDICTIITCYIETKRH